MKIITLIFLLLFPLATFANSITIKEYENFVRVHAKFEPNKQIYLYRGLELPHENNVSEEAAQVYLKTLKHMDSYIPAFPAFVLHILLFVLGLAIGMKVAE